MDSVNKIWLWHFTINSLRWGYCGYVIKWKKRLDCWNQLVNYIAAFHVPLTNLMVIFFLVTDLDTRQFLSLKQVKILQMKSQMGVTVIMWRFKFGALFENIDTIINFFVIWRYSIFIFRLHSSMPKKCILSLFDSLTNHIFKYQIVFETKLIFFCSAGFVSIFSRAQKVGWEFLGLDSIFHFFAYVPSWMIFFDWELSEKISLIFSPCFSFFFVI